MITFPQVMTHKDVVVFPDDEDPNTYYLLSGRPRLRVQNGKPVFRGLFWTDDASGTGTPSVAGLRGALLHFDVNLSVPEDIEQEIKKKIEQSGVQQQRVDELMAAENERRARMAKAQGVDPASLGKARAPEVRPVRFGSIQYTGGNVELLEEKSGGFVAWSSAGGPPSLIGDNNAAFALRLGPEGAAVWYRGLEQDATAIGVRYELKFQVRLPSLMIHVWAGSHQKLEVERNARRAVDNMDQGCSDADVERVEVESISEKLVEEGLINVEIVKGTAKISDEQVSQLRNTAINLISDRVKEILMHKIRGLTEDERKSSLLKTVTEEVTSFAELRLTQRDVIEWGVNPQATITDFLGGLTGDKRKGLVTLVDLSDPVVSTLEVQVSVNAPWDADPGITRVIVKVEYPAALAKDDPKARQEFAFDKANPNPQTFRCRRVKGDKGSVNYTAVAFVKGAADPIAMPKGSTNGHIHVEVPLLGAFSMRLRPAPNVFGLRGAGAISAVQVNYRYKNSNAPDHVEGSMIVRAADLEQGVPISHKTFRQIDQPIVFKPTYIRETEPAIEGIEQQIWLQPGTELRVDVPQPWRDFLEVGARVPPGIEGLKQVRVDLQHIDGQDFASDSSILMDGQDGDWSGKTTLPQLNKANQRFRYRYSLTGEDQLVVGPWVDAEGDQPDIILPVLAVKLRTDRLKLGTDFTEAIVRLEYADAAKKFKTTQEFFLTKEKPSAVWLVPRTDPNLDAFKYSLTLFKASGESVDVLDKDARGANLILQPPQV